MRLTIAAAFLLFFSTSVLAQTDSLYSRYSPRSSGKRFYFYWGWNRAWYSDSDIRFSGSNYNFTLDQVKAADRQSAIRMNTYADPTTITIPQTVMRIGYCLNTHWDVSIGTDHMKYVMGQDQTVNITGKIEDGQTEYNGTYDNDPIQLTEDFLKFEHTDGLNYINVELRRSEKLIDFSSKHPGKFTLNMIEGLGAGVLVPRTNTTLLGKERYDEFHLSGYGIGALAGMNIHFGKYFFLQSEAKFGYINMPDIRTTHSKADYASQHFTFFQWNFSFGTYFYI